MRAGAGRSGIFFSFFFEMPETLERNEQVITFWPCKRSQVGETSQFLLFWFWVEIAFEEKIRLAVSQKVFKRQTWKITINRYPSQYTVLKLRLFFWFFYVFGCHGSPSSLYDWVDYVFSRTDMRCMFILVYVCMVLWLIHNSGNNRQPTTQFIELDLAKMKA